MRLGSGGNTNTGVGVVTLEKVTGNNNTACGALAGSNVTIGFNNSMLGLNAGTNLTSGAQNLFLGVGAGQNITTTNNNIFLANDGIVGDSAVIRIGAGQVKNFQAGIRDVTSDVGGQIFVYISSGGQLCTLGISGTNSLIPWLIGGNAGTDPTTNYIGTSDITNLRILTNGSSGRGLLITPTGTIAPINGTGNTYFGANTGNTSGVNYNNTFFGFEVGNSSAGINNTCFGFQAGNALTSGDSNTLIGMQAGRIISTGVRNTVIGLTSGNFLTAGNRNTLVGQGAGFNLTTGSGNTFLGSKSNGNVVGGGVTTGNDNIYICSVGSNESNTVRIGDGTQTGGIYISNGTTDGTPTIRIGTQGVQTRCFIAGCTTVLGPSITTLGINGITGQIGLTGASSIRFKEDVRDLGDDSSKYLNLRPVSFIFKSDENKIRCSGLIAEEVVKIAPELVYYDMEGQITGVNYHELVTPLLNETMKLKKRVDDQDQEISDLKTQVNDLETRLARLEELMK
jgi:hypothetical protein